MNNKIFVDDFIEKDFRCMAKITSVIIKDIRVSKQ